MSDLTHSGTVSLSLARRIDDVCNRFEDAWRSGPRPLLEQYLGDWPAEVRPPLLRELLRLDLAYRRRNGEQPAVAEYLSRLPADGELIRAAFSDCTVHAAPAADDPLPQAAGEPRYVPVQLHARGGLGEVHVARDAELRRTVALKRIQDRWAGNAESRRRFLVEAEVTGRLEHPGIVPVYGLERDANGEPCYAMRFIEGETLRDAIRRIHAEPPGGHPPALRQLLGRFVAICNTVAYAHSRGVLHRDLKPANCMLGPFGETLVVDWGLAKVTGAAPAALADDPNGAPGEGEEPGGTRKGDVVGTPAYMSPEQAAGRGDELGPASDVYSLGATLYEILTNRPPFSGDLKAVLDQVRRGDFPSPRQLNPAVPRALEAVCLKAMALRPADRYPSALALAEDVEHWLADEPVSVYRGTVPDRLGRWSRRHRLAVAVTGALVVAALIAVSLLAWQSEQGRWRVEQEREQVKESARRERQAIRTYFVRATEDPAWKTAGLQPLRRKLLKEASEYLRGFVSQREDPELLAERAEAYFLLAAVTAELGDRQQAVTEYESALALHERLSADNPALPGFRLNCATDHLNLAKTCMELSEVGKARVQTDQAIAILDQLVAENQGEPKYRAALARGYTHRGELLLQAGDLKGAVAANNEAISLLQDLHADHPGEQRYASSLAGAHNSVGVALSREGDLAGALAAYNDSRELSEKLVKIAPEEPQYRWDLAMTLNNLGVQYERRGDRPAARRAYERSRDLHRQLHAEHPAVAEYRRDLAMSHNNLGTLLWRQGDLHGARREFEQAAALREVLVQLHAEVPDYRQDLARCYNNLGGVLDEMGNGPAAREALEKALAVQEVLARQPPRVPEYQALLADSYTNLGISRNRRGDRAGGRRAAEAAAAILEQLAKDHPGTAKYILDLSRARFNLAVQARDEDKLSEAADWCSRAIKALGEARRDPLDYQAHHHLCLCHFNRAFVLFRLRQYAEAGEDWDEAVRLWSVNHERRPAVPARDAEARDAEADAREQTREALDGLTDGVLDQLKARPAEPDGRDGAFLAKVLAFYESIASGQGGGADDRHAQGSGHFHVATLRYHLGELAGAEKAARAAIKIYRKLADEFPERPDYLQSLAASYSNLGVGLLASGQPKEAKDACQAAVEAGQSLVDKFPARAGCRAALADGYHNLGTVANRAGLEGAEQAYRSALELRDKLVAEFPGNPSYLWARAETLSNLGALLGQNGRPGAEKTLRAAHDDLQRLADEFPTREECRYHLAGTQLNLGNLLSSTGRLQESEKVRRVARATLQKLVEDFPAVPEYRSAHAMNLNNLGNLLRDAGRFGEAEEFYRDAIKLREQLRAASPTDPLQRSELARYQSNLGVLLVKRGRLKDAGQALAVALDLREGLQKQFPSHPGFAGDLASSHAALANLKNVEQDYAAAREHAEQALAHLAPALKASPKSPMFRRIHRDSLTYLGMSLLGLRDHAKAAETAGQLARLGYDPAKDLYPAARCLAGCAAAAAKDDRLPETERPGRAKAHADEAMKLLQKAIDGGFKDADQMTKEADLEPLRGRDDFRQLLKQLQANNPPEKKP